MHSYFLYMHAGRSSGPASDIQDKCCCAYLAPYSGSGSISRGVFDRIDEGEAGEARLGNGDFEVPSLEEATVRPVKVEARMGRWARIPRQGLGRHSTN